MYHDIKAGDILYVSGKGFVSSVIQMGTLSLPNIGTLGRWGWSGASHVAIVGGYDETKQYLAYESTSFTRPPCARTGRENPKGVQAHRLSDIIDGGGDVWHLPIRRPLYTNEQERLLAFLESCLGRGYDFIGAGRSGGGRLMRAFQYLTDKEDMGLVFCSELVVSAYIAVGIMQHKNAGAWSPQRLVRHTLRRGITQRGRFLS